jgi:hypothetical protein
LKSDYFQARGADKTWSSGLFNGLRYYPESLLASHLGLAPITLLTLTAASILGWRFYFTAGHSLRIRFPIRASSMVFASLASLCPLVVLTANPHRTPAVVGVAAIAFILPGFLSIAAARRILNGNAVKRCALATLLTATCVWTVNLKDSAPFQGQHRLEAEALAMVFNRLCALPKEGGEQGAQFAILDLNGKISMGAWFFGRERLRMPSPPICTFPTNITAVSSTEILDAVKRASAVIVPRDPSILLKRKSYPLLSSIHQHYNQALTAVRARFTLDSSFTYRAVTYDLYVLPGVEL